MDTGLLRGLITVAVFCLFAGIAVWAFSRARKSEFDAAARLPLEEDQS